MQIKDIAALAGVGHSTVSRYLNGGYVSEEKRIRIKKVIEETGYVPSRSAQSLRSKVTKQIGVIIPKLNSDSISKMVSGISQVLKKEGYYLILANVENNENDEINYLELFNSSNVDGIILLGSVFTPRHEEVMADITLPFVILAQHHDNYSCVYHNNVGAAMVISENLMRGRRYPAIITTREDDLSTGYERKQGFLNALKSENLENYYQEISDYSTTGGYEATKRLIKEHPEVDCIFCATDHIAVGAIEYLKEAGRKIPEEITIGCVGGTEILDVCSPKISCIDLEYYESGAQAAKLLLEKINGAKVRKSVQTQFVFKKKQTTY